MVAQDELANHSGMAQDSTRISNMNNNETVVLIRTEVWEIEALMKKLQRRCDNLTTLADKLEREALPPEARKGQPKTKFRKIVDSIYGETK